MLKAEANRRCGVGVGQGTLILIRTLATPEDIRQGSDYPALVTNLT